MAGSPRPLLPSARTGRTSTATCNRGCPTFYTGTPFTPRFGGESRAKHLVGGAKELCLDDSVRCDVDTPDGLRAAVLLGVGVHTAAVVRELELSYGGSQHEG